VPKAPAVLGARDQIGSIAVGGNIQQSVFFGGEYSRRPNSQRFEELADGGWSMKWEEQIIHSTRSGWSPFPVGLDSVAGATLLLDGTVYSADLPPFSLQREVVVDVRVMSVPFRQILVDARRDDLLAEIPP
jgi:hypothetical protein